jgi:hypothetical protein
MLPYDPKLKSTLLIFLHQAPDWWSKWMDLSIGKASTFKAISGVTSV